jgi:hypothetical protein
MFYYIVSKLPFIAKAENKIFKTFLIGSICYIILHTYLFSSLGDSNELIVKYRQYIYYLFAADCLLTGIMDKFMNKDNQSENDDEDASDDSDNESENENVSKKLASHASNQSSNQSIDNKTDIMNKLYQMKLKQQQIKMEEARMMALAAKKDDKSVEGVATKESPFMKKNETVKAADTARTLSSIKEISKEPDSENEFVEDNENHDNDPVVDNDAGSKGTIPTYKPKSEQSESDIPVYESKQ